MHKKIIKEAIRSKLFIKRDEFQEIIWPDLDSRIPPYSASSNIGDEYIDEYLYELFIDYTNAKNDSWILDIGGGNNSWVEYLQHNDHKNAFGIDVDPQIENSLYGFRGNFRDINPQIQFDIIHFMGILDYFAKDRYPRKPDAFWLQPLSPLLEKLNHQLKPGGIIYAVETAYTAKRLHEHFSKLGYTHIPSDTAVIFIKPE